MFKYGLLLLTYRPTQLSSLLSNFGLYLKTVNSKISKTLYISLESNQVLTSNEIGINSNQTIQIHDLIKLVPRIYIEAHKYAPLLDVRVLHHQCYHQPILNANSLKRKLYFIPEVIYTNQNINEDHIKNYLNNHFDFAAQKLPVMMLSDDSKLPIRHFKENESTITDRVYDHVCFGGTFDNLHNGHKILLSTSQLKCNKSLTIGVTDRCMVKHKTLWELIESPQTRIDKLSAYLQDVDPFIKYNITPITDPFGPAIVEESLQAIIVSEETRKGGTKINEIRSAKKMSKLEIEVINMLTDGHRQNDIEEEKVSSSSLRIRKLGTLLKEPDARPNLADKPYIIGLTGMIASGKSSISQKLRKLGAGVINVDLLAHQTYRSSTSPAYKDIVDNFGISILDAEGNIDRRKLGEIVFDDKEKLQLLNGIIWPQVEKLVANEVNQLKSKYNVIVLEIALLIEANWINRFHQVWVTILDEKEVIRRLQDRNQLSEQDAIKRVKSMLPSHEKVPYANVVFCTAWEESVTWEQVKRAWKMLTDNYL